MRQFGGRSDGGAKSVDRIAQQVVVRSSRELPFAARRGVRSSNDGTESIVQIPPWLIVAQTNHTFPLQPRCGERSNHCHRRTRSYIIHEIQPSSPDQPTKTSFLSYSDDSDNFHTPLEDHASQNPMMDSLSLSAVYMSPLSGANHHHSNHNG